MIEAIGGSLVGAVVIEVPFGDTMIWGDEI